jgi:lysophospholipase L1-like esterase
MPVHRTRTAWTLAAVVTLLASADGTSATQDQTRLVDLRSGDRVVFIGGTFFEREYRVGLIETALTLAHPDKTLTFRNLGWSGDTVWGEARAYFGERGDGYKALLTSIDQVRPDVVLLAYGSNESFAGESGLQPFLAQYGTLLSDLASRATRIVLLTPLPTDAATSPLPRAAVDERNRVLAHYAAAIVALAKTRGLASIDLFTAMHTPETPPGPPRFTNGLHLTDAGYLAAARHIAARTAPAAAMDVDPLHERWAALRALIVEKNDLFFHRWRPANVTYLYLFRKGEQGKNAAEIPAFDPLIAQRERAIAAAGPKGAP